MQLFGRWWCVLVMLGVVVACKPARKAPPPFYGNYGPPFAPSPLMTAPPPPPLPLPPPVEVVPPSPAAPVTQLVAHARPALGVSTLQDDVIFIVNLRGSQGYLADDDPLGQQALALDQMRIVITLDGAQTTKLITTTLPAGAPSELRHHTSMALRVSGAGVERLSWMQQQPSAPTPVVAWEAAPSVAPFSEAGDYEVSIGIELPLASGTQLLETEPMQLTRRTRGRATTTLAAIEKFAEGAAALHLNKMGLTAKKDLLAPTLLTVDLPDADHQRLVRFWLPDGEDWKIQFLEVVVERNGTVVKVNQQERFTCVAAGTRIDTEHGTVAIEDLERGQRVWSWDPLRRERVLSQVVALSEPRPAATMLVGNRLRVTGNHRVLANGAWVRADELTLGSELTTHDGSALVLETIATDGSIADVFDVTVTWPHNFFADGILVHNKRLVMPPERLDPLVVLWERATGTFDLLKPATP